MLTIWEKDIVKQQNFAAMPVNLDDVRAEKVTYMLGSLRDMMNLEKINKYPLKFNVHSSESPEIVALKKVYEDCREQNGSAISIDYLKRTVL